MRFGLVESLAGDRAVGVEDLLVAAHDLASADWPALVHAAVFVGDELALHPEHAELDVACDDQHTATFRDLTCRHHTVLERRSDSPHRLHLEVRGRGLVTSPADFRVHTPTVRRYQSLSHRLSCDHRKRCHGAQGHEVRPKYPAAPREPTRTQCLGGMCGEISLTSKAGDARAGHGLDQAIDVKAT